jgi:hypothetical protein
MTRTVRSTLSPCAAGLAGVAAVLLLTGCGGGGGDTATGSSESSRAAAGDAQDATEASGSDEFCTQAAGIDQRVDSAMSDLDGNDPSVAEIFRQIATELRGITAPRAISADWTAMATGLDRMADAFADLDITDLDSLESLDEAEGNLTDASTHVEDYLSDECGI